MERGISKEKIAPVDEIVDKLIAELVKEIAGKELIVMVNGMGGTPLSELDIVTKYVAENLSSRNLNVNHWIVGEYMTSLDMQGFSITLAPHSEELETALKAPTTSLYFE